MDEAAHEQGRAIVAYLAELAPVAVGGELAAGLCLTRAFNAGVYLSALNIETAVEAAFERVKAEEKPNAGALLALGAVLGELRSSREEVRRFLSRDQDMEADDGEDDIPLPPFPF